MGFSLGSAVGATILASYTPPHSSLPERAGFNVALFMATGLCVAAAALSAWLGRHPGPAGAEEPDHGDLSHLKDLEEEAGELAGAGLPMSMEGATVRVVLEDEEVAE